MIPDFPDFVKLKIDHKQHIKNAVLHFPPYSDFNFVSLLIWDTDEKVELSILNKNLVVKFSDYLDSSPFYSFLGKNKVDETAKILLSHAKESGYLDILKLVPQTVVDNFVHPEDFTISEDRDNFDYILSTEKIVEARGKSFSTKRNLINRFQNQHGHDTKLTKVKLSDPEIKKEILELFAIWEASKNKTRSETQIEFDALNRLLDHSDHLELEAIGLYIGDKLRAFTAYELVQDNHGIIHFEKADINFEGIYPFIKKESSKELLEKNAKFINFEQDLGLEGMRKSKELLGPVGFLKKYTVSSAN